MNEPTYTYYKIEKENRISYEIFYRFIYAILIAFALILVLGIAFENGYGYVTIQGTSMQPTLNPDPVYIQGQGTFQDAVFIKYTQDVDYGDIIVINVPEQDNEDYSIIKRVIAKEGDYISIVKLPIAQENGQVEWQYRTLRQKSGSNVVEILQEDYILSYQTWSSWQGYQGAQTGRIENGNLVVEREMEYEPSFFVNYLQENECKVLQFSYDNQNYQAQFFCVGQDKNEDEPDQIFFMGDNRTGSTDARVTGTRDVEHIIGKVVSIVKNATINGSSFVGYLNYLGGVFELIWKEILTYFAFPI